MTDALNIKRPGSDGGPLRGWVCYDAECGLCARWARRAAPILEPRGWMLAPLQDPAVRAELHLAPGQAPDEMAALLRDGRRLGGADALLHVARSIWWGWPLFLLAKLPGMRRMMRRAYARLARNRCRNGVCPASLPGRQFHARRVPAAAWLPLPLLVAGALLAGPHLPAWAWMWLLAGALYAGCKWLTWRHGTVPEPQASLRHAAGYLLLWPGMDPRPFQEQNTAPQPPAFGAQVEAKAWGAAAGKVIVGAAMIWLLARFAHASHPLLGGWAAMLGIVLFLHFGCFHLLALFWQSRGIRVEPIMRAPALADSLAGFWGGRWNRAFSQLADAFILRPLRHTTGVTTAMLLVFLASGLIHELVISIPARGGHGLPTAYFLIQGAGLAIERSKAGRKAGLNRGAAGRLFTLTFTAAPLFWLFHPPFIHNVMIPFLAAIRAL